MANRVSESHQRAVLTIGGTNYDGWHMAERPDNTVPVERHVAAGAAGDVVTPRQASEGGTVTLTRRHDEESFHQLKDAVPAECEVAVFYVDLDGRKIGRGQTYTGVFAGIRTSNFDASSSTPAVDTVTVEADGETS